MREAEVKRRLAKRKPVCAIALPHTRGFRQLVNRILTPLSRLCLHILYVGEDELWHQAPGEFLPRRIASLKEALSNSA